MSDLLPAFLMRPQLNLNALRRRSGPHLGLDARAKGRGAKRAPLPSAERSFSAAHGEEHSHLLGPEVLASLRHYAYACVHGPRELAARL